MAQESAPAAGCGASAAEKVANDPDIYSGLIWTGERGLELGLVDALGSSSFVAREIIGAEDIVNFTVRPNYAQQLVRRLGASIADRLFETTTTLR